MISAARTGTSLALAVPAFFFFLAVPGGLSAQTGVAPESVPTAPTLRRVEGTDSGSGMHYVRLLLSLPAADTARTPRFTVECQDWKGKHSLQWFVSFGGVDDPGFAPPFVASRDNLFPPKYPAADLKMSFEGYLKPKVFIRSWALAPWGEFRYRNPGMDSPNMESPRYFMTFLNALPGLRIGRARPARGDKDTVFFPTRPLLDEMQRAPICSPE